jgi:hypothetical protein
MNASLEGKKCWYGDRIDTLLLPDFYDVVEISGGVPIPQTGTFPCTKWSCKLYLKRKV